MQGDLHLMKTFSDYFRHGHVTIQENGNAPEPVGQSEPFEIVHINDFASEEIKSESHSFEEIGELSYRPICSALHGGPLDYPKVASTATANVVEKWDFCYSKLEIVIVSKLKKSSGKNNNKVTRKNSDEEVYEQLTGDSISHQEPFDFSDLEAAMSQIDESKVNEEEFFSAVSESTTKLAMHNSSLSKAALAKGDVYSALKLLGSLALMRNKLWHYNEKVVLNDQSRIFQDQYTEVCALFEALAEQILSYQSSLISTTILHDPESNDWTNHKAFYEGEKMSHNIQMWWYSLQGLKMDLWNTIPPKTALRILEGVYCNSLGVLTSRYALVSPSPQRLNQYKADLAAILLISIEFLQVFSPSLDKFMEPKFTDTTSCNIHAMCNYLFSLLSLIASPISTLSSVLPDFVQKKPALTKKSSKKAGRPQLKEASMGSAKVPDITWMRLMKPALFKKLKSSGSKSDDYSQIIVIASILANQPEPHWPLVVQNVLCKNMALAKLIVTQFGAFVPGSRSESAGKLMTDGCEGFECNAGCIGSADITWPQSVATAVLVIAQSASRDPNVLIDIFDPLLKKLKKVSWESLNSSSMWNPRKPVFLEAMCLLVEPYLEPVLMDLFAMIESGKAWRLSHVDNAVKEILLSLQEIIPLIPIQVLNAIAHVQKLMPDDVKPLSKNVLAHVLVSALYTVVSRVQPLLKKRRIAREKLDFLIAFGEALCNLETRVELLQMQNLADQTIADGSRHKILDRSLEPFDSEASLELADITSNDLLGDKLGALSLKIIYRFICYNVSWIAKNFGNFGQDSGVSDKTKVSIRPWSSGTHPQKSPYDMMSEIDWEIHVDQLMNMHHSWESYLQHTLQMNNPLEIANFLNLRTELHYEDVSERDRGLIHEMTDTWKSVCV